MSETHSTDSDNDELTASNDDDPDDAPLVGLDADQRTQCAQALEHLVTVGNFYRHEAWRRNEWIAREKIRTEPETKGLVHLPDLRQYGNDDTYASNAAWQHECGDCIHPIHFARERLSNFPVAHKDQSVHLQIPPTLTRNDAPRALALHCWDRAMHAASTVLEHSVVVKHNTDSGETTRELVSDTVTLAPPITQNINSSSSDEKQQLAGAQKRTCHQLGIELAMEAPFACPSCASLFDTREQLERHFMVVSGCSTSAIQKRQRTLWKQLFERQVEFQCEQLLQRILRSNSIPAATTDNEDGQFALTVNWKDIIRKLQQNALNGDESLDVNVLAVVHNRLIQRYSKVPR
jgi:hypothetical protein